MSNEPKQDPNVPDAVSMTYAAIDNAKTTATIETMRAAGNTDEEIAAELLLPMTQEEEKQLALLLLITALGELHKLDSTENKAAVGFALIFQHYAHHPVAKEWTQFAEDAKTVGEVYKFFLEKNDLSPEFVQQLPDFDPEHFEQQLAAPFPQVRTLTIRPE